MLPPSLPFMFSSLSPSLQEAEHIASCIVRGSLPSWQPRREEPDGTRGPTQAALCLAVSSDFLLRWQAEAPGQAHLTYPNPWALCVQRCNSPPFTCLSRSCSACVVCYSCLLNFSKCSAASEGYYWGPGTFHLHCVWPFTGGMPGQFCTWAPGS